MAPPRSVWGVDIGQCALKAIKLREVDGQLMAEAFDAIEHPKILSEPEADREALIRSAMETFLSRNDTTNCRMAVTVSGQTSFTKFVKMPPVDAKRIPDLVRFEAEQQIPFDINEVIWRWQSFPDPDSPDLEVGLFAIKQSDVYRLLAPFSEMMLDVELVQMAPLALFNFMDYDHQTAEKGATLMIDIGADSTDLVVSDGPRMWTRTVQLGGNNFTETLVKAFKLSFAKAEKLKVTAATSKYARQVFQAMRPVFADLVQEIQRSIGYYTSLHRQSRFVRTIGLGNGFRLPGLQKFLEQNLNMPVVRVDNFNALQLSPSVSAASFSENVLGLAVAYGVALQALGLTKVNINLLPGVITAHRRWAKKRPWFTAAAGLIVVASLAVAFQSWRLKNTLTADPDGNLRSAQNIENQYRSLQGDYSTALAKVQGADQPVKDLLAAQGYRSFWPHAYQVISDSVLAAAPDQAMLEYNKLDDLKKIPGEKRRLMVIESIQSEFIPDMSAPGAADLTAGPAATAASGGAGGGAGPGMMGGRMPGMFNFGGAGPAGAGGAASDSGTGAGAGKGFKFVMVAKTPLDQATALAMFNVLWDAMRQQVKEKYPDELEFVGGKFIDWIKEGQSGSAGVPSMDAMRMRGGMSGTASAETGDLGPVDSTGYPLSKYNRFQMVFILKAKGDGVPAIPVIEVTTTNG